MLAYAGKCLGEFTGKALQNATCIVFFISCASALLCSPKSGFNASSLVWIPVIRKVGVKERKIRQRRGC